MNNLEWLFEHCADFRSTVCSNVVIYDHWYSGATGGMCFEDSAQAEEWFLSPHVGGESCRQYFDQAERVEQPDCENDTREKLEADVAMFCNGYFMGESQRAEVRNLLDRQAAITRRDGEKGWQMAASGPIFELKGEKDRLREKVDKLEAERDEYKRLYEAQARETACQSADYVSEQEECAYWKQQVQRCMDSAYLESHSPKPRYAPEVMEYPRPDGYTDPATMVSAVIDGLRDAAQDGYFQARLGDVAKLETECILLAKDLAESEALREELREKLGRAIGNARDTLKLVDLDGEVVG